MSRNAKPLFLQFIVFTLLGLTTSLQITSYPSNQTYANKGSSILLNWNYTKTATDNVLSMKWYQTNPDGTKQGNDIISILAANNPEYLNSDFTGRVSYVPNGAMLLSNVSFGDEGPMKYEMRYVVNGALITYTNTIYITVTIPPTIVTALANQSTVFEKRESRYECVFDARPSPAIKWYLNNIEMNNIRYNINTTTIGYIGDTIRVRSILVINSSTPEDTGVISCIAILPNSNTSSATNHIVLYKPRETKFTSDKVNVVGNSGESATLNCTAEGTQLIFYQLYKDGVMLRNSTSGVYILNSVSVADDGVYTCSPLNFLGDGPTKQLSFNVQVLPNFLASSGTSIKTVLGSHLALPCIFYGEPTPNVTWRKHQSTIPNTANINTTVLSSNSSFAVVQSLLILGKVSKSDYGLYECMANNVAGFLAQNISVDVQYEPSFNKSLKQNYTLVEDSKKNESWVCRADGNPEMSINWMINGKPAINGFSIIEKKKKKPSSNGFEIDSILTMVGINRVNAGSLMCNVSNSIGNIQSHAMISIQFKPELVTSLVPVFYIQEGTRNHKLRCIVVGNPEPKISWFYNGTIVKNNSNIQIINRINTTSASTMVDSVLEFKVIRNIHYGNYSCMASSALGNVSSTQLLLFKTKEDPKTAKVWVIAVGVSVGVFAVIVVLLFVLGRLTRKKIAIFEQPTPDSTKMKRADSQTPSSATINNAYETIDEHKL